MWIIDKDLYDKKKSRLTAILFDLKIDRNFIPLPPPQKKKNLKNSIYTGKFIRLEEIKLR